MCVRQVNKGEVESGLSLFRKASFAAITGPMRRDKERQFSSTQAVFLQVWCVTHEQMQIPVGE